MRKWIIGLLKNWLCREELAKLDRYQRACALVYRWNGELVHSSWTAQWIKEVGEGERGQDISEFREHLREDRQPDFRSYPNA